MAVTLEQIEALRAKIVSGERSVSIDGDTVVNQDLAEMRRTLRELEAEYYGGPNPMESMARRRSRIASNRDLGGPSGGSPYDWNR